MYKGVKYEIDLENKVCFIAGNPPIDYGFNFAGVLMEEDDLLELIDKHQGGKNGG